MTDTRVSSASREWVIGFERPFTVVGERINPDAHQRLARELAAGAHDCLEAEARAQAEAGAHLLDVHAAIALTDETAVLAHAVERVQACTELPLCIDSSSSEALAAALAVYRGKALVNAVSGEEASLATILPLVRRYGAAVVALPHDESGIADDPDARFSIAQRIVERAADHGITREDILVDPLLVPAGAVNDAARRALELTRRLRAELGVNTVCGASNVSFGLGNRHAVTGAFLTMAIGAGMTAALLDPLRERTREAVCAGDLLMGRDRDCARWLQAYPRPQPAAARDRTRRGLFGRRRRG